MTSTEGCIKLNDDGDDEKDEQVNELNYQIEVLKEKKEQFFSLEVEIERNLKLIDVKNVESAVIDTSQDGRALTPGDFLSGRPTSSFTEKVDTAHEKEVAESLQVNNKK